MPSFKVLIAPFILYVLVSGGLAFLVVRLVESLFNVAPRVRMALYASALAVPVVSYLFYFTHILGACSTAHSPYTLRICSISREYANVLAPFTASVLVLYLGARLWQYYTSPMRVGGVIHNDELAEYIARTISQLGGDPELKVTLYSNHFPAAFVRGILTPELCLTTGLLEQLDDRELRAALAHEIEHIKGRDNLYNLVFLLKEIAFFAPHSHMAYARYCQAREEAADQATDPSLRLDLASALIKVVRRSKALVSFSQIRWSDSYMTGGGDVARRIELLICDEVRFSPMPVWFPAMILSLILLFIC